MPRNVKMKHGTRSTYTNYKCRCPACKKANRDYQRPYMRSIYKVRKSLAAARI